MQAKRWSDSKKSEHRDLVILDLIGSCERGELDNSPFLGGQTQFLAAIDSLNISKLLRKHGQKMRQTPPHEQLRTGLQIEKANLTPCLSATGHGNANVVITLRRDDLRQNQGQRQAFAIQSSRRSVMTTIKQCEPSGDGAKHAQKPGSSRRSATRTSIAPVFQQGAKPGEH